MSLELQKNQIYELISTQRPDRGFVIRQRRVMVGCSEACNITIKSSNVSAIHAVIEVQQNKTFKVYDMNSVHGTFVNDQKVVAQEFALGDKITFGSESFYFREYSTRDLPPTLDMLDPTRPPRIPSRQEILRPKVSTPLPQSPMPSPTQTEEIASQEGKDTSVPQVVEDIAYPLARDPQAEFSEYIFEDSDSLYPIFKYEVAQSAAEVIILFKDRIYAVDYLPQRDGVYKLVGKRPRKNDIEYAYLGSDEKVDFIEMKGGELLVHNLDDYHFMCLGDGAPEMPPSGYYLLKEQDIARFHKGDLQIFVRKTDAPPRVKSAPLMRRDKELWKWIFVVFLLLGLFMLAMANFEVDFERDQDKIPDRIATILYQKDLVVSKEPAIDKTEEAPPEQIQKSPEPEPQPEPEPEPVVEPVPEPQPEPTPTPAAPGRADSQQQTPQQRAEAAPGPTNQQDQVRPTQTQRPDPAPSAPEAPSAPSQVEAPSDGPVDTFQARDFSANMNRLMARGGSTREVDARSQVRAGRERGTVSSADTARLERARVSEDVGSLSGAAQGQLDETRGAQGLVERTEIFTAGTPFREVVLGGMDPDLIRRRLVEHIPQFRHCYQQELDRASAAIQGVVRLDFMIGASGSVTRAGVQSAEGDLPQGVQNCVTNVLRGIRFPAPRGGGVVEVSQPMNFYPRQN